jgi:hypothetical protein
VAGSGRRGRMSCECFVGELLALKQVLCGDEINVYIFVAGCLAIFVLYRERELKS